MNHNNHIMFKVIQFAIEKKYFSFNQLREGLGLQGHDENYVWQSLVSADHAGTSNPNHILALVERAKTSSSSKDHTLALLPNALVQYVDFLEIVEARKNSEQAKVQARKAHNVSLWAIGISVVLGIAQIVFSLLGV